MTILDQIDRVTGGLCPCGALPADGSAYCSDDCRPTHIAEDTDQTGPGGMSRHGVATPMRWRPDLVTDLDDSDLIPVDAPRTGYTGRYNATVFRRRSNPDLLHLRLDDGHRQVGLDVADVADEHGRISFEAAERVLATWRRLERDLVNPHHTEPISGDPWADVFAAATAARIARRPIVAGQLVTEADLWPHGVAAITPDINRLMGIPIVIDDTIPAGEAAFDRIGGTLVLRARDHSFTMTEEIRERMREHYVECGRRAAGAMAAFAEMMRPAMQHLGQAMSAITESLAFIGPCEPTLPTDPMERALHARRNRNTGPPSDRLDGRRRRR